MVRRMIMRRAALVCVLVAASLAWAGPATAAVNNAYESGSTLYYVTDTGVASNVVIRLVGDEYTIDDVDPVEPGFNCKHRSADLTIVHCGAYGITLVWVETLDLADRVDYLAVTQAVVRAGAGNDTVWGGTGIDALWGEGGNDFLNGWSGNDWIVGGVGTDQLHGGAGGDIVSYADSPVRVIVDLDGVADDGAVGENDVIGADFEELHGSKFNDQLIGNAGVNSIYGLAGNDSLYGLGGDDYLYGDGFSDHLLGADFFSGGDGIDWVGYGEHTAAQPVSVDLDGAVGDDGAAGEGDTIAVDVENVGGTPGADVLTGNAGPNRLDGWQGNDTISGLGGNDSLFGQQGHDWVYGGDGDDLLSGEDGNDHLYGQNHADTLNGGIGTDVCDVGPGGSIAAACE